MESSQITVADPRGSRRTRKDSWLRRAVTVVALAVCVGSLSAASGAIGPTTNVGFTPLTPPFKVLSNAFVGANVTKTVVITGGTTTVPTNVTTVQLTVAVSGAQAGTLSFNPTGNPAGSSGQTLTWVAGGTASRTIQTDVGQKNSLDVVNSSAASAKVTLTITGYSADVEARDISGLGGSAGQVLTNTGPGASWQAPQGPAARAAFTDSAGFSTGGLSTIVTLNVPAGKYFVDAVTEAYSGGSAAWFKCYLISPAGQTMEYRTGSVEANPTGISSSTLSMTGLLQTSGGNITVQCVQGGGTPGMGTSRSRIIATQVGSITGVFTTS